MFSSSCSAKVASIFKCRAVSVISVCVRFLRFPAGYRSTDFSVRNILHFFLLWPLFAFFHKRQERQLPRRAGIVTCRKAINMRLIMHWTRSMTSEFYWMCCVHSSDLMFTCINFFLLPLGEVWTVRVIHSFFKALHASSSVSLLWACVSMMRWLAKNRRAYASAGVFVLASLPLCLFLLPSCMLETHYLE